jgi:dihydrofolate reductase
LEDVPADRPLIACPFSVRRCLRRGTRVIDGIERALELAREAANGRDVRLWGGAQAIQQYMAAGLLDELELHVGPMLLGDGERLFGNLGDAEPQLEQVRAIDAPGVTHLKYRVRPGP